MYKCTGGFYSPIQIRIIENNNINLLWLTMIFVIMVLTILFNICIFPTEFILRILHRIYLLRILD
jgi:hypothetical protein